MTVITIHPSAREAIIRDRVRASARILGIDRDTAGIAEGAALRLFKAGASAARSIAEAQNYLLHHAATRGVAPMDQYAPSTEAERLIDERRRNADRLRAWRIRFHMKTGHLPALYVTGRRSGLTEERHGNGHVVKMPRYRHQIRKVDLPDGPDAA